MRTNPRWPSCLPAVLMVASVCGSHVPAASAQTPPAEIVGHKLPVPGSQIHGTTAKLSEVEQEIVSRLSPQGQAERLLQYAISRHVGATDEIKARVKDWRGTITRSTTLDTLLDVAMNGADLRVRAAACEIELAAHNIAKSREQVDALAAQVQVNPKAARQEIWLLGFLANRGVDVERILGELRALKRSEEEDVRYQAVAAIAYVGTDETVQDLLDAFHHDTSFNVRINGGGCGLAHCGMLTRAQRMKAVPGLIEMVDDGQLDRATVSYGYRALREITDETLPDDAKRWRDWYAAHGADTTEKLRQFDDPKREPK